MSLFYWISPWICKKSRGSEKIEVWNLRSLIVPLIFKLISKTKWHKKAKTKQNKAKQNQKPQNAETLLQLKKAKMIPFWTKSNERFVSASSLMVMFLTHGAKTYVIWYFRVGEIWCVCGCVGVCHSRVTSEKVKSFVSHINLKVNR